MHLNLKHRLTRLEKKLAAFSDVPPCLVFGEGEDGEFCLLWAGWQQRGKYDSWDLDSGLDAPPDLVVLVRKHFYQEQVELRSKGQAGDVRASCRIGQAVVNRWENSGEGGSEEVASGGDC
jgi:hypothetical protein